MKKKTTLTMIAALICIAALALSACSGLTELSFDGLPDNYDGMSVAEGKSALTLYHEAHQNFLADTNYRRVQFYDFATTAGITQSMQIKTTRKVNGDKIYNEEVVLASGIMSLNEGKKVYFDQTQAYSLYFNDSSRVSGKGEDIFAVSDWDALGAYDTERYGAAAETKANFKTQLCLYNLSDNAFLSAQNDNTVYQSGDKLYFTLTVDCSDAAIKGAQRGVAEAIAKKTSGSADNIKMKADTVISAAVQVIDGKLKFVYLKISESYNGKLSVFNAECKSTYFNEFYYGNNAGVADDTELKGAVA